MRQLLRCQRSRLRSSRAAATASVNRLTTGSRRTAEPGPALRDTFVALEQISTLIYILCPRPPVSELHVEPTAASGVPATRCARWTPRVPRPQAEWGVCEPRGS